MKKFFKSLSLFLTVGIFSTSTVLAAVPCSTVVIGNNAYDLKYANDTANIDEIRQAVINSSGKIFIKSNGGLWVDNNNKTIDSSNVPEVKYKSQSGVITEYKAKDGDLEDDDVSKSAADFIDSMAKGDFSTCESQFSDDMKKHFPEDKFKESWEEVTTQFGSYKGQVKSTMTPDGNYKVATVECKIGDGNVNIVITFDSLKHIVGLQSYASPDNSAAQKYKVPSYTNSDSFTEKDVTVGNGEWALPGTLSIPKGKGPFPAVVLVHGSGAADRDETVGPNKPFKDLACGLASNGIAVLRYEKRTKQYGMKIVSQVNAGASFTVKEETMDDAVSAVELLRKTEDIDGNKIFVLGHSLGGELLPRIYMEDPNDIAGLISMAGGPVAQSFGKTMSRQYKYLYSLQDTSKLSADDKAQLQAQLDKAEQEADKIDDPNLSSDTPASELFNCPASYWIDLRNNNPLKIVQTVDKPMLFLQGERDYQVTMDDLNAWKNALKSKSNVTFKTYPKLDHLFIEGEGAPNSDEYNNPENIPLYVVDDIINFIKCN